MKLRNKSRHLLKIIKSQAKMWEYDLPLEDHNVQLPAMPDTLFPLTIGLLGDLCRKINDDEDITDLDKLFTPQFFDSFVNAKFSEEINNYLYLLGSAAFYLADMPGSALVLARKISDDFFVDGEGLELLLKQLLLGKLDNFPEINTFYNNIIQKISNQVANYFSTGQEPCELYESLSLLRKITYGNYNPRCLLLADIISAVVRKKINYSAWKLLPTYSNIPIRVWESSLERDNFIKELWPAQRLIGEAGCYDGNSAVIQMPTSAGKTKSIEIILRSAFLSDRDIRLAVIVAPFCALCHEIKDSLILAFNDGLATVCEISDVLQMDFSELLSEFMGKQKTIRHNIIILTPEKLLYVLRHSPELASKIGLIVFDEAHQFDSGKRGVTYELLLTELKMLLLPTTQKVLISAVISNAESIAEWFNGTNLVVRGEDLTAMPKAIGFAHWIDKRGQISYRSNESIDNEDFFVPRVIEAIDLEKKGKERKIRTFPTKNDAGSIALYLGLKLVKNGAVAIFCGQKRTANNLVETLADALDRNLSIDMPVNYSDLTEIKALYKLQALNMGKDSNISKMAKIGIFQHHGNMPHGIRIAIEHAIKEGLVKFVICTSTLAQGVNLPIRYLIVASTRPGQNQIKTRDFHNLIGRAGRAGQHTEGSIIFADHTIYDLKNTERWRWQEAKNLLDSSKSESCTSSLMNLFSPIKSDDDKQSIDITTLDLVNLILKNEFNELVAGIRNKLKKSGFDKKLEFQMREKREHINALESFLLSDKAGNHQTVKGIAIEDLAKHTLAYHLADNARRVEICEVFKAVSNNIDEKNIPDAKQKIYGKTLLDLESLQKIEGWLNKNVETLNAADDTLEMLDVLWPLLSQYVNEKLFNKLGIVKDWINNSPYYVIAQKLNAGLATKKWSSDMTTDLLENKLAFESSLVFGAIIDITSDMEEITKETVGLIMLLQQQIKYGLPNKGEISIYEMGFTDRVIVADLKETLDIKNDNYNEIKRKLKSVEAKTVINKYPSYFRMVQSNL